MTSTIMDEITLSNLLSNNETIAADNENKDSLEASKRQKGQDQMLYKLEDVPPIHLTIVLGMQQFLTMFGGVISVSLLVARRLCMEEEPVAISRLLATSFFVYGIVTLIQTTFGVRLPIVQGGAFSFVIPIFAIGQYRGDCQSTNDTSMLDISGTKDKEYEIRIREIQGAMMIASCVQVVVGFTGIIGSILRFIGPLSIASIMSLVGLSLVKVAAYESGLHWGIAALSIVLIILFSQYLSNVEIPCVSYSNKQCRPVKFPVFKLFPIIIGILTAWIICAILTATNVFPDDPSMYGYAARTDRNTQVLHDAPWFAVPYPGQWGTPTVSVGSVIGVLTGVLASIADSIGDYYACARMSGAPPPPPHAINRGIGIEGIGCILCGAFGTASGSTSFSENIGAIGITKVGSRVVIQAAGAFMVFLGLFTKFSAIFSTIPIPVVGGVLCCTFGMVTAVGVANLQYVDMNSSRNLFVFGFSTLMGLVIPHWIDGNPGAISTGVEKIDQLIIVLLSNGMFVGGCLAIFFDNTIRGTREERGLLSWTEQLVTDIDADSTHDDVEQNSALPKRLQTSTCYDLPLVMKYIRRWKWTSYLPFSPTYQGLNCRHPTSVN